jgi:hypothetical protein
MDTVAHVAHSRFKFAHVSNVGWKPAWIKGYSPIWHLPTLPTSFKHPNPSLRGVRVGKLQGTFQRLGSHG